MKEAKIYNRETLNLHPDMSYNKKKIKFTVKKERKKIMRKPRTSVNYTN